MAVNALELLPRRTVALYDAAIRLCSRNADVWALTLPAGAAITAAVSFLADEITHRRSLALPALALTLAWVFRAASQGAACYHLEQTLLADAPPSIARSALAALKRLPSLIVASTLSAFINASLMLFTLGIGFFFAGAHQAIYAVTLKGQGSALAVYGTSSRLLGGARHTATFVRFAGLTQVIVALNLHLTATGLLYAAHALLAFDVTFASRFVALDNGSWVATIAALTFALYEPLRAATATLLLIDGRVRQEGLDLLAALEQLPKRTKTISLGAAALVLCLSAPALAQDDGWSGVYLPGQSVEAEGELADRFRRLLEECSDDEGRLKRVDQAVGAAGQEQHSVISRFLERLERKAYDQEDCAGAMQELDHGLGLWEESEQSAPQASAARAEVKQILERPEFFVAPPPDDTKDAPSDDGQSWLGKLWERFLRWLFEKSNEQEPRQADPSFSTPALPLGAAGVVVVAALVVVLAVVIYLLVSGRKSTANAPLQTELETTSEVLDEKTHGALARAPEGWASMADALAAQGRFREAIRSLYLALLSSLHRAGAIDYQPTKSNWDYFRGFRGAAQWLSPFKELTRRFDFAWYGNLEVGADSYQTFRGLCAPVLSASQTGGASA